LKILTYGQTGFGSRLASLSKQDRVEILNISQKEDIPAVFEGSNKPDLAFIERNAVDVAGIIECIKSLSIIPIVVYIEANNEHWQGLEELTVDGYVKDMCSSVETIARLSAICRRVKLINSNTLKMPDAGSKKGGTNDA
jgi:hypothetical protein